MPDILDEKRSNFQTRRSARAGLKARFFAGRSSALGHLINRVHAQ